MDDALPTIEFAFPGPLRDSLIAAIKSGAKTATSSLLREYEVDGESVPFVGYKGAVIDSEEKWLFVVETTDVDVVRLQDVPLVHALAEGEGYESVAEWRAGHTRFWSSDEMRSFLGADFKVDDDSRVVLERFAIVGEWPPCAC